MATMRTIKIGSKGPDVQAWQTFLRGGQIDADGNCTAVAGDSVISDGVFGPVTDKATKTWQKAKGLTVDGIVGPNTWAEAIKDSYPAQAVPDGTVQADVDTAPDADDPVPSVPTVDKTSPSWPPRPDWAKPLVSQAEREAVLGKLTYVAAPTASNPEAIRITNDFAAQNIAKFSIPLLSKSPISMHKIAGPQFQAWCRAIEAKGLADRILSFSGCWVPRYVRGSRTRLSNHTWGSAIDINVPYNGRGRQSALVGKKGCVREIAELAPDFGVFWGGWYRGAPEDGMHFEIFKALTPNELQAAKVKHGIG